METAPRRFVKPLAPPVVAQRSELEGLSQIKDFEVCSSFVIVASAVLVVASEGAVGRREGRGSGRYQGFLRHYCWHCCRL